MSIVGPPEARPADGLAVDFVVESDRAQLSEIVQRVRDGRLADEHRQRPVVPFNIGVRQIALNPDGSRLLMLVQRRIGFGDTDRMLELDPQTLQEITSTPLLQLSEHGTARSFAILNEQPRIVRRREPSS